MNTRNPRRLNPRRPSYNTPSGKYPPGKPYLPLDNALPPNPRLAEAYVPIQNYDPDFDLAEALLRGTLFPSLYRPEFVVPCTSYSQYVATRFARRMVNNG